MTAPLRFCFGLHLHQPVGNFDSVFEDHLTAVYGPVIDRLERGDLGPVALHISGPLLAWLDQHATDWVDRVGRLVNDHKVELLAAGHDEPILAVLGEADRTEQIARHRELLLARFGVDVRGLWLTERVWEPDLPRSLVAAGMEFVLVDDRHLRVTGLPIAARHRPWVTEHDGARLTVLAIDQNLRYLVPFRPPEELTDYLSATAAAGHPLAVLADDGEKFGGWPGTAKSVWEEGWFDRFTAQLRSLQESGSVVLSRFDDAIAALPSAGLAYLPSASYLEMERWALPAAAGRELTRREAEQQEKYPHAEPDPLLRGGHWRHFLVKYPESNRLHKVMQYLSNESKRVGDPAEVRRHIGLAQCNDAYWHGVFGGLYLPFLRGALWSELAAAARLLYQDAAPLATMVDIDKDGHTEGVVVSADGLFVVAPARGGALEVALDTRAGHNWADALGRHEEAYHKVAADTDSVPADNDNPGPTVDGTASIHDAENVCAVSPAFDIEPRAIVVDRFLPDGATLDNFITGTVQATQSFANARFAATIENVPHGVMFRMVGSGITKTIVFHTPGPIDIHWSWGTAPIGAAWFSSELSLAQLCELVTDGAERWEYPIETVSRSEAGFDHTRQGTAVVFRWPAARGSASVRIQWTAHP